MKRSREPLSKSEYEKLAAFRFALGQFLHFSEQAAGEAGLTPQQHQALLAIKGFPGREIVSVRELATRLHLRHHTVVELVDRLEKGRLVARRHDETDRRKVLVELTSRGERLLEKLSEVHREQLLRIGPQLNQLLRELMGEPAGGK